MADTRPEGTDQILTGNADLSSGGGASGAANADGPSGVGADAFRGQVSDKARDFAEQGKDRATEALDDVARLIGDNAAQIDELLGATYGDYARGAADYVGGTADTLRDKDVDELVEDARDLIRRAPAAAMGLGAVVGFAVARIVKAGSEALEGTSHALRDGAGRPRGPDSAA